MFEYRGHGCPESGSYPLDNGNCQAAEQHLVEGMVLVHYPRDGSADKYEQGADARVAQEVVEEEHRMATWESVVRLVSVQISCEYNRLVDVAFIPPLPLQSDFYERACEVDDGHFSKVAHLRP